jgi:FKBP-type peptidyl-prolyl cis-trans isomerase
MQCISGFQVKVVTSDNYITRDSGLMYEDIKVGTGNSPKDGQQVLPPKRLIYFLLLNA